MVNQVLVTGAHGFIGRHIAKYLSKKGWLVIGIGHGKWASVDEQAHWGLSRWVSADLTLESLKALGILPCAIVHCAGGGAVGPSWLNPYKDFSSTAVGTMNLLEYARLGCVSTKIIYLSSAAVYGEKYCEPIKEADSLGPISPYGFHKMIAEELCRSYAQNFGMDITVLRLFSVYGAGLQKQLLWDACRKIKQGTNLYYGTGRELRDWIHINDVTKLIEILILRSKNTFQIVNGGLGKGVSTKEVLDLLYEKMKVNVSPVFTGENKVGDPVSFIANNDLAASFGWDPLTSLEWGISDYINWFRGLK